MTNLTEQDLRRIETIEGYLRKLDMYNPAYSLPQFKPYQPIDTTEGEKVMEKKFAQASINIYPYLTKGKWYEIIDEYAMCWQIKTDMDTLRSVNKVNFHPPITHAEFLAQEQGKEWKVGEWVKWGDKLGIIAFVMTKIQFHYNVNCQNGKTYIVCKNEFIKPTDKEVETWLVAIAEKKYPVGTKVKCTDGYTYEVKTHNFTFNNPNWLLVKVHTNFRGEDNYITLYNNGKWAELAPIETEQRWLVNVERTYDHLNEYRIIVELDEKNGLKKERADKAADFIKQYLSINKF
jgi:hypothetical protein